MSTKSIVRAPRFRGLLLIVIAVGCSFISACNSSLNVPVSGKVIVKGGLPLDEGQLVLIPQPTDSKRTNCGATIGTDGKFTCYATAGGAGIPPGKYKVLLTFSSGKGNVNPFVAAFRKYTQADTTPLVLDVPAAGIKDQVIELDEPPAPEEKSDAEEPAPPAK